MNFAIHIFMMVVAVEAGRGPPKKKREPFFSAADIKLSPILNSQTNLYLIWRTAVYFLYYKCNKRVGYIKLVKIGFFKGK